MIAGRLRIDLEFVADRHAVVTEYPSEDAITIAVQSVVVFPNYGNVASRQPGDVGVFLVFIERLIDRNFTAVN